MWFHPQVFHFQQHFEGREKVQKVQQRKQQQSDAVRGAEKPYQLIDKTQTATYVTAFVP